MWGWIQCFEFKIFFPDKRHQIKKGLSWNVETWSYKVKYITVEFGKAHIILAGDLFMRNSFRWRVKMHNIKRFTDSLFTDQFLNKFSQFKDQLLSILRTDWQLLTYLAHRLGKILLSHVQLYGCLTMAAEQNILPAARKIHWLHRYAILGA